MPSPYSIDLRKRIVQAYLRGEGTYAQLALRFSVSEYTVGNYVALFRKTGGYEPLPRSGGNPTQKLFEHHWKEIEAWLDKEPGLFWDEVAQRVLEHFEITIDASQLSRIMKRRGYTRKKTLRATPK